MTEKESLTDAVGTSFDLFDALAEAVFLLDDEGRITSANAAAETLIGRTRRALSGVDVAEFLPEAAGWFRRRAAAPGAVEAASFMLPAVEFLRGLLPCEPLFRRFRLSLRMPRRARRRFWKWLILMTRYELSAMRLQRRGVPPTASCCAI